MISRRKFSKSALATGAALLASTTGRAAAPLPGASESQSAGRAPKPRLKSISGLIHTPPTPYTADNKIDADTFQKLVDFLVRHGANVFSHPMHVGEGLTLTHEERRLIAKLTVEAVHGRIPVFMHTSCPGTDEAVALSQHAQAVGADGICVTTPYYWLPPAAGVLEHFVKVGTSVDIALVAYHNEKAGPLPTTILPEMLRRCPNLIALKEAHMEPRYIAEVARLTYPIRPEFGIFAGGEYPLYTMPAGGTGCYSPMGFIAPRLVRALVDACTAGDYKKAMPLQWKVSELTTILAESYSYSASMAAGEIVGRPCGNPRLPIPTLDAAAKKRLETKLMKSGLLDGEPHGWT
jgi:4-hydroxy-tetrahydrodipicolinate synthase